jgi:hypothetical protein
MEIEVKMNMGLIVRGRPHNLDDFATEIRKLAEQTGVTVNYVRVGVNRLWIMEGEEPKVAQAGNVNGQPIEVGE